jgi:hypothetical protein
MWIIIVPLIGLGAFALAIVMYLMPREDDKPRRKRARSFQPDQSGRWEGSGAERRNAK